MRRKQMLVNLIILGLVILPLGLLVSGEIAHGQETAPVIEPMELDGTQWEVEMVYVSEKGKKEVSTDILKFSDKKFISENFEKMKYTPTNYSMTLEEDGTTKFGTMQIIKDKETSFWKGVVRGETVDGSVHTQFPKGSSKTVYFTGKLIGGTLLPVSEAKVAKEAAAAAVEPPAPQVPVEGDKPIQAQLEVTVVPPENAPSDVINPPAQVGNVQNESKQ